MSNDFLSQEEIDALLNQASRSTSYELEDEHKDLLGEIGNICMGSAATTLSIIINQPVSITTPKVNITTLKKMKESLEVPNVAIEVKFINGLSGVNLLVLKLPDAKIIADLMMGGAGKVSSGELSEIELSAVSEAMNQMIGTAATSMATMFRKEVNISPPDALQWDNKAQRLSSMIDDNEDIVKISFRLTVGNMIDSEIMQLLSIETANEIITAMTSGVKSVPPKVEEKVEQTVQPNNTHPEEVTVHRVEFPPFEKAKVESGKGNIDLILDVPIEVSVILGRTKKSIKEILELNNGSLIVLDKLVEEPVEVLVNGKMVAQGEVVVVNENFGIRITNIISSTERVKGLQGDHKK